MRIRFWGVRGSLASPIIGKDVRDKIKAALSSASPRDILDDESIDGFIKTLPYPVTGTYGGNTTCMEIRSRHDDLIIIDAGTGLRGLGNKLLEEEYGEGRGEGNMLFTHTHWDHIQGLPFFAPFHKKGNIFHIHAIHENIEGRLRYQHNSDFFPVYFDQMPATKYFYKHAEEESWEIKNIEVKQKAMVHPGTSYSYRLEEDGKVFIFCSDAEFSFLGTENEKMEEYIEYFRDADLLVIDAQYTFEDQLQKIDWGHSSSFIAMDIAARAKVKKLALFHHDPSYSDKKLDQLFLTSLEYKRSSSSTKGKDLEIFLACEGVDISL